jgi:alpha-beta hydrolase superfamily lysophospholipase
MSTAEVAERTTERPLWLPAGSETMFAFVHEPVASDRRGTGVVICPPFGWDEMCSHRARRTWARALAAAGFPAIRIDLPGSGESSGVPEDPERPQAWKTAIANAAAWMRENEMATRVVAIGIGVGGLMAFAAAADGAPIDDLMLWAVPARGRTTMRELRAYAGIVAARYEPVGEQPESDGTVEVTGFVMSRETAAEIDELDLTKLELPDASGRRVLLIKRDELGVDRRLREHLERSGVSVTTLSANDYALLMGHPQEGRAPLQTIQASIEWLRQGASADQAAAVTRPAVRIADGPLIATPAAGVSERILELSNPSGRSFAVLSEPVGAARQDVCAVLLNAGALRRIGPNRMWVEVSRRWAARGVPTVRLDLEGIGDSDGDERLLIDNRILYGPRMIEQTVATLDQLAALALPQRFVLVGLCSGAYWALHAALTDPRVVGAFMVNLYSFYWSEQLVAERDRHITVSALRSGLLKRVLHGEITPYHVRRALRSVRVGTGFSGRSVEAQQETEVTIALDKLRDQGTEILMTLSEGEPLYDQFEREGRLAHLDMWPNVTLERIADKDHEVRALPTQTLIHEQLDRCLERLLGRPGFSDPDATPTITQLTG